MACSRSRKPARRLLVWHDSMDVSDAKWLKQLEEENAEIRNWCPTTWRMRQIAATDRNPIGIEPPACSAVRISHSERNRQLSIGSAGNACAALASLGTADATFSTGWRLNNPRLLYPYGPPIARTLLGNPISILCQCRCCQREGCRKRQSRHCDEIARALSGRMIYVAHCVMCSSTSNTRPSRSR